MISHRLLHLTPAGGIPDRRFAFERTEVNKWSRTVWWHRFAYNCMTRAEQADPVAGAGPSPGGGSQ